MLFLAINESYNDSSMISIHLLKNLSVIRFLLLGEEYSVRLHCISEFAAILCTSAFSCSFDELQSNFSFSYPLRQVEIIVGKFYPIFRKKSNLILTSFEIYVSQVIHQCKFSVFIFLEDKLLINFGFLVSSIPCILLLNSFSSILIMKYSSVQ